MPNTMSMTCIKKHSNFLKSTMLGLFAFAVIASPLSVSFLNAPISNVAYADTTPPAGVVDECGSGKHADWSVLQASMSYSSYVALGVALTSGGAAAKQAWDQIKANANVCVDNTTGKTSSVPQSCSSVLMFMSSPFVCMFRSLVTLTAGSLIYISSWILSLAALLFNWLIDHTVIGFGELYTTIKPAVETAWTAFRDIANILIIGMFVFIAISIILGLKEFGQKRLIANVLIIAVLINFSLLFTKMIIDASNFTATQVYTAANLGGSSTAGPASTAKANYGIADQFLYLLGVGTYGDSLKLVYDTAEAKDSGWAALGHGIIVMIVLLGAALVILYGCFLLVSRMLMLIFLMITASVAFASYLIPAWAKSAYGWKAWWSSLLWCAAFAPILVLLLWTTLNISYALKGTSKATLGAALSDPTGGGNTEALFMYVIVLGLLFISFKISSMTAGEIGGFSWAQLGTALPFTMASRFALAPLLRQTAGLLGTKYQSARLGEMKDARKQASTLRKQEAEAFENMNPMAGRYGADARKFEQLAAAKLKAAQRASPFAEGKMNLMDTPAMKAALGEVGVKGFAAGASVKDTKGYEGQQKARTEAAEKLAAKAAPSAADNEKAKTEARRVVREQRQTAEAQLEATKRVEKATAEQIKQTEQLPSKLSAAQQNLSNVRDSAEQNKVSIASNTRLSATRQKTLMDAEDRRIKAAEADVKQVERGIAAAEGPWRNAEKALKDHQEETERLAEGAAKTIVAAMGSAGENIAQEVGEKSGDVLTRTLGSFTGANEEVGKKTRDMYKKKRDTASLTAVMAQLQADAPPPTPPPATP